MNHQSIFFTLLLLATIGSGLMSGLFFVFSNFAMKAFTSLPPDRGAAAMQSINVTIINPAFLTVFLGTGLVSLGAVVFALLNGGQPGTGWVLAGGILYLAGCLLVTICFNVPLNNELAALDPENPASFAAWQSFVARWLPWNHVRTFATLAATAAFAVALRGLH